MLTTNRKINVEDWNAKKGIPLQCAHNYDSIIESLHALIGMMKIWVIMSLIARVREIDSEMEGKR